MWLASTTSSAFTSAAPRCNTRQRPHPLLQGDLETFFFFIEKNLATPRSPPRSLEPKPLALFCLHAISCPLVGYGERRPRTYRTFYGSVVPRRSETRPYPPHPQAAPIAGVSESPEVVGRRCIQRAR
ncbi:hypothetical protein BDW02DRAFT_304317 [Decorospora gaudefroyi]|uniref:Uncharacterized protein n=1 Tax=Decorospora gaudefroyi TaxID=184978 RepID=A0A6A5KRW9_9PLEO|nr:hypothetical protein BDW02DRAFT_304317 [Decorospora gaudefroyi]